MCLKILNSEAARLGIELSTDALPLALFGKGFQQADLGRLIVQLLSDGQGSLQIFGAALEVIHPIRAANAE